MEGRRWSAERFIVFQAVILQWTMEVRRAQDIRQKLERRIDEWKEGHYCILVKNKTCTSRAMISKVARGMCEEAIAKTLAYLVLKGVIRTTV